MKKCFFPAFILLISSVTFAQSVDQQLQKAFQQFESDVQLKHALSSLYVIDAATGQVVFDKNSQLGMAPASTQKIITSVTAFELLGKDYRYKTEFFYLKKDRGANAQLGIRSFGDPTFGSPRYISTKPDHFLPLLFQKLKEVKFPIGSGRYNFDNTSFETKYIPDGWIMQDIGNYYGAGASALNWRENQYDLVMKSPAEVGGDVSIVSVNGLTKDIYWVASEVKAAAKGTGDNAYIYFKPEQPGKTVVRGTIPVNEDKFTISGAMGEPVHYLTTDFSNYADKLTGKSPDRFMGSEKIDDSEKLIYTHYSPRLDSIIYWFNKKSINLYGEALVKTFAYQLQGFGVTDSGVAIVRRFWEEKGLDKEELNIYDGSGLSPLNRVTTHAQVEILKYAKSKDWYPYFFNALPEYNGMKMKSGTISDVKGFCGYHKAANGKEYIFSFLVNNYSGRASELVGKMYKVLDVLK